MAFRYNVFDGVLTMTKTTCILLFTLILSLIACSCSDQDKITAAFQDGNELANGTPVPFLLGQNQPNPFNGATSIGFEIGGPMHVTIKIYTEDWQEVITLFDKTLDDSQHASPPWSYIVVYNPGMTLKSGDYYYTMEAQGQTQVRMMKCVK